MENLNHTTHDDIKMDVYAYVDNPLGKSLRGKIIIAEDNEVRTGVFIQHLCAAVKSTEIGRTQHSRIVRHKSGNYVCTFRFAPGQVSKEQLLCEMRDVSKAVDFDVKNAKNKKADD